MYSISERDFMDFEVPALYCPGILGKRNYNNTSDDVMVPKIFDVMKFSYGRMLIL